MAGALVGEAFPEEVVVAEKLAVVGTEDNVEGLPGAGVAVLHPPLEDVGDAIVDMVDEGVVGGLGTADNFRVERAGEAIRVHAGLRVFLRRPLPDDRAGHFLALVAIKVGAQRHERRVRMEKAEMEEEGRLRVAILGEELRGPAGQPVVLVEALLQGPRIDGAAVSADAVEMRVLLYTLLPQPAHVVVTVLPGGGGPPVGSLAQHHVVEAVALAHRVEVQLADQLRLVAGVAQYTRQGERRVPVEPVLVALQPVGLGMQAAEQGAARRDAHRAGNVTAVEVRPPRREGVEVGRLDHPVAVDPERVVALLVGGDEENVGAFRSGHGGVRFSTG